MILNALCDYYDIMTARGVVLKNGFSRQKVNYRVCLSQDGAIEEILDLGIMRDGKKMYPEEVFPLRTQKPGIKSNIIEHRPLYLFGLNCKEEMFLEEDRTNKAKKSHKEFVCATLDFLDGLSSPLIDAFRKFVERWQPSLECENLHLKKISHNYENSSFDFCLSGKPNDLLQYESAIIKKWENYYSILESPQEKYFGICPVYGECLPIARLHDKIRGIKGGQSAGCVLVCFNNESENSYGKEQAYNSSVSNEAMKKYSEALNYLLKEEKHHAFIDGMTIVYFAMTNNEDRYIDCIKDLFDVGKKDCVSTGEIDENLDATVKSIAVGSKSDFTFYDRIDENVRYYIFGLVPNKSRLSLKFCYTNTFGALRKNIEKYQNDFAVEHSQKAPPFWKINTQLKSPKATASSPPDVTEALLRAALCGTPFPMKILETVVRRIKTDNDIDNNHYIKMNDVRIGLLKACLNRKSKIEEEKITMALNEQNENHAYLCGRLFAVLEKIQQDASGGGLNRTIKDAYFSAAAATPAAIFARLIKLSNHHMVKLNDAAKVYYSKLIETIMNRLEILPKSLTLVEQANFIVGYYQQNSAFYIKKNKTEEN